MIHVWKSLLMATGFDPYPGHFPLHGNDKNANSSGRTETNVEGGAIAPDNV